MIGLKKITRATFSSNQKWNKKRQVFIQSEVEPEPIVTRSRTCSYQLHVFTSSFDWFIEFSVSLVITYSDNIRFDWKLL